MRYARILFLWLLIAFSVLAFPTVATATNYITAVGTQQFSITIASGSLTGTATITATGSGAFISYGGINPSQANTAGEEQAYLTLTNSTTITATRAIGTAGTIIVTGSIVDGDTTNLIKSVQYGTVTIAGGAASGTASISAVTNNNTAIHYLGTSVNLAFAASADFARLSLSGTTVTATLNASNATGQTVGFVAIEFQGAALNQAVQNVSAASSGTVSSWTATITSVTTNNAITLWGGWTTPNATFTSATANGQLTNGTTFTVTDAVSSSNARIYNCTVVEFIAGLLNSNVQRGTTTLTGVTSNTSTITAVTAADSGISFLWNSNTAASTSFAIGEAEVILTDGTTVTTQKANATNNVTSSWEVFEFPAFSGGGQVSTTNGYPDNVFFGGWP